MLSEQWSNAGPKELRRKIHDPPPIVRILETVGAFYGVPRDKLVRGGQGKRNEPRVVAMYLCQEVGGMPLKSIAGEFGIHEPSAVSHLIGALRRKAIEDAELAQALKQRIHQ